MFLNKIGVLLASRIILNEFYGGFGLTAPETAPKGNLFLNMWAKSLKRLVGDDRIEPHSLCKCLFNKGGGIQTD